MESERYIRALGAVGAKTRNLYKKRTSQRSSKPQKCALMGGILTTFTIVGVFVVCVNTFINSMTTCCHITIKKSCGKYYQKGEKGSLYLLADDTA